MVYSVGGWAAAEGPAGFSGVTAEINTSSRVGAIHSMAVTGTPAVSNRRRTAFLYSWALGTTAWIWAPYRATSSKGMAPACWAAFKVRITWSGAGELISNTWPRIWVCLRRAGESG